MPEQSLLAKGDFLDKAILGQCVDRARRRSGMYTEREIEALFEALALHAGTGCMTTIDTPKQLVDLREILTDA